jgi:SAM-dependent methyltransferase
MDEFADFNKARWEELAAANVEYSRPLLDLTVESARHLVDPFGVMGDVQGKNVLCLASGGGQQSAAFGLLGAQVTMVDLSETQLERDRIALAHYGLQATLLHGDMRDLSGLSADTFDVVWHAFSINFVPDSGQVFDQVRRVLRANGRYRMQWHNPFTIGTEENSWNGQGYVVKRQYKDGEVQFDSPYWDFQDVDGTPRKVEGPREFNHTLSTVVNGLVKRNFALLGIWEEPDHIPDPEPGTWEHLKSVLPLWLTLWAKYTPEN